MTFCLLQPPRMLQFLYFGITMSLNIVAKGKETLFPSPTSPYIVSYCYERKLFSFIALIDRN